MKKLCAQVIAEAGVDFDEAHLPLLLHAAYGAWPLKLIVLLRNPVDRLVSAFWSYAHYKARYGATAEARPQPHQFVAFFSLVVSSNAPPPVLLLRVCLHEQQCRGGA